jgi:hypothetical protein
MPYWARNSDSGSIKVMGGNGELNRSTLDEPHRNWISFQEARCMIP